MSGFKVHTVYYDTTDPITKEKLARFEKLYGTSPWVTGPYNSDDVLKLGNQKLAGKGSDTESDGRSRAEGEQLGNPTMFPENPRFDWANAPNVEEDVKVDTEGKAVVSPYIPDIRSPGKNPGANLASNDTRVISVNFNPNYGGDAITHSDIKPTFDPGGDANVNNSTRNPALTSPQIHAAQSLETPPALGTSTESK
jgi:hypothetical protein